MGDLRQLLVVLVLFSTSIASHAQTISAPDTHGVVILEVFFADSTEPTLGTGFFVDDDGLIVTADHILRGFDGMPDTEYHPSAARIVQKVTIHSPALGTPIDVDSKQFESNVRYGAPKEGGSGDDIGVLRVSLPNDIRSKITPHDLAGYTPFKGSGYWAAGPACATVKPGTVNKHKIDPSCYEIREEFASITTTAYAVHQFDVTAQIAQGFSGGPLFNSDGFVVGIASSGDTNLFSPSVSKARFTSWRILAAYLSHKANIPPSLLLGNETTACPLVASLSVVTSVTLREILVNWNLTSMTDEQCKCCCAALDKFRHPALDLPEIHCPNKLAASCPEI